MIRESADWPNRASCGALCSTTCVWLAQDNFGDTWPNKVIIASSSALDLLDVMKLQSKAQGMGVVLCTETHWSLLCIRMGAAAAYLYDGVGCKKTWELAEAVMSHVNERQKCAAAAVRGDFPRQEDGWSCGHRLVKAFQYFLRSFTDGVWPPAMPADEFTLEAIRDFCEGQDDPEISDEEDEPPLSKKPRLASSGAAASGSNVPLQDSKAPAEEESEADVNPALKKRRDHFGPLVPTAADSAPEANEAEGVQKEPKKRSESIRHTRKAWILLLDWVWMLLLFSRRPTRKRGQLTKKVIGRLFCRLWPGTVCSAVRYAASCERKPLLSHWYQPNGGPTGGSEVPRLISWMQQERSAVYRHISGARYFCRSCDAECSFYRETLSAKYHVLGHESSAKHKRGLQRLGAGTPTMTALVPCAGIDVKTADSVQTWISHGMMALRNESEAAGALSQVRVCVQAGTNIMRHKDCDGGLCEGGLCRECKKMSRDKRMLEAIAAWARRLDGSNLIYLCVYKPKSLKNKLESMLVSDYAAYSNKCRREVETCLQVYDGMGRCALHELCRRWWLCLNSGNLTPELRQFIRLNVADLELLRCEPEEQLAYEALCEGFDKKLCCNNEDLELAAYIAAGKMRPHIAVNALLHTFVQAERRISSGAAPLRHNKSLPDDVRIELASNLGQSEAAVLSMFHVTTRGSRRVRMDFCNPMLPEFYISHTQPQVQERSCATVQRLLAGADRRLHIAIDETYWRPTFSAISHFGGKDVAIVGGGWTQTSNKALLQRNDPRADADLSRMSVSFVATRCDCNKHTYELNLVPLPGKEAAGSKSELFVQLLGQLMEHFEKTGQKTTPVSVAWDGVVATTAFTALKAYTLHHNSASRTVHHGIFATDLRCLRKNGLAIAAFTNRDGQSDEASFQRMSTAYLNSSWENQGVRIYIFLGELLSSIWNCGQSPRATFTNAMTGFYLLLLHVSEAKRIWGADWREKALLPQTVRNLLHMAAHAALAARFNCDPSTPWHLRSRQERHATPSAGDRLKRDCSPLRACWRGNPSLANAIYSTQLEHLKSLRDSQNFKPPEFATAYAIDEQEATELSQQALSDACFLQSSWSKARTASSLHSDLLHWFQVEGCSFVTSNRIQEGWMDGSADDDVEELVGCYSEEAIEDPAGDQLDLDAEQALQNCDDHLRVRKELELVLESLETAVPEAAVPQKEEAIQPREAAVPVKDEAIQPRITTSDSPSDFSASQQAERQRDADLDVHRLVEHLRQLPAFQQTPTSENSLSLLLQRAEASREPMFRFARAVQMKERFLSAAQIQGAAAKPLNGWDAVEHELALARQASMLTQSGERMGRIAAWTQQQALMHGTPSAKSWDGQLQRVTHFGASDDQILLFHRCDGSVGLCYPLTTFRGAVLGGINAPRRLRVARPSASPLPAGLCKAVRAVEMVEASTGVWLATALNPVIMLDTNNVLAEVKAYQTVHTESRLTIKLTQQALAIGDR
ncbi:Mlf [Symbiodinium sp. CCMP2592]|nr:Mlf [Symbiodinium sp. CCMP2592]